MASSTSEVAFFGATGGCTAAALTLALNNGYKCSACMLLLPFLFLYPSNKPLVARTPERLIDLLISKNVPEATISTNLRSVKGDVKDETAVKQVLVDEGQSTENIIFGIGMPFRWPIEDTIICQKAMRTVIAALKSLALKRHPSVTVISTTGISHGPRDVPLAFLFLYKIALHIPHKDKKVLEQLVTETSKASAGDRQVFDGATIVRASLLMDGEELGKEKIREGSEQKPSVGYTIRRVDVGRWIYENSIVGGGKKRRGETLTVTY